MTRHAPLPIAALGISFLSCLLVGLTLAQTRPPLALPDANDNVEMVIIPTGSFDMGSAEDEVDELIANCKKSGGSPYTCEERYDAETPRHRVQVEGFFLDKTEATQAQFARFVQAARRITTAEAEGRSELYRQKEGKWGWEDQDGIDWRYPVSRNAPTLPALPVVHVSWTDAVAYCAWAGKRLPTEAEWEYAARGTAGLKYPWGNRWNGARARHFGNREEGTTAPVGSYPDGASPFGVLDLSGNVWEWTDSLFRPYPRSATDGREAGAAAGKRTVRGGGWNSGAVSMRSARRAGNDPTNRNNLIGFRCARTP
jgi:eukaryotic-like serine/threonine-protein kinase